METSQTDFDSTSESSGDSSDAASESSSDAAAVRSARRPNRRRAPRTSRFFEEGSATSDDESQDEEHQVEVRERAPRRRRQPVPEVAVLSEAQIAELEGGKLDPVSAETRHRISSELFRRLSFASIGEKVCCVCDQLTPACDMMNQRILDEPQDNDNLVFDGFLISSNLPIDSHHPNALNPALKTAMDLRLAPPVQDSTSSVPLHPAIVLFYNIKAFFDSHFQTVGADVRIPDDFGKMMLSHRGVVVNSAFFSSKFFLMFQNSLRFVSNFR